jgi:hypothetical protein
MVLIVKLLYVLGDKWATCFWAKWEGCIQAAGMLMDTMFSLDIAEP